MRKLIAVLGVALAAFGCTEPTGPLVGDYQLRSVNGASVPTALFTAVGSTWSVQNGTLTLRTDSTWTFTYLMTFVNGSAHGAADPVPHDDGTFSVHGDGITFYDHTNGAAPIEAQHTGKRLVFGLGSTVVFSFRTMELSR